MKKLVVSLALSVFAFAADPWSGADYNKHSAEQKAAAEKTLQTLSLSGDEQILDIGCGDGYLTSRMGDQVPDGLVVGLDLSPSMISFASSQFARTGVEFRALDARRLDYENRFDLVTSFTTLHWIPEQSEVLERIQKALRPSGRLIADMPTCLPAPLEQAVNETMQKGAWSSHFDGFSPGWRFFSAQEYEELLYQAHLEPSKIQQIVVPHTFPSRQAFMGFLKQWFPYLRPLPEEQKMVFLGQVVDRYLELFPPDNEGRPVFEVSRLRIEACKN